MRKSKVTPERILQALRQAEGETAVVDACRNMGVTETTFYRWRKQCTRLDVSELRGLNQLREEKRRLKTVVADLTLDKTILRDALGQKWQAEVSAAPSWLGPRGRTRSANAARTARWPATAR